MPPKKKSVIEISPPDPETKLPKTKTVAARHTITYEAPVDVPVTDLEPDEPDDIEGEIVEVEEAEERERYRPPSFRAKLKNKFQQKGIGGDETLHFRIDRLPLFDQNGYAGVKADKEFCGIIQCTEKFFDNDEYLIEIQRRYGPGEYWLTVRHKNSVVNSWRERVGGFPSPQVSAPVVSENGQIAPQIIYQAAPNQPQQPVAVQDPLAQMRGAFKLVREFKADLGLDFPAQQQPPQQSPAPLDPKVAALQLITENPDVMERIGKGIANTVLGKDARVADDWPSVIKEIAIEAIKSGQAPQILGSLIREFMSPFKTAIAGGQNGQAQMVPPPLQNQTQSFSGHSGNFAVPGAETEASLSASQMDRGNTESLAQPVHPNQQSQSQVASPEEQVLTLALDHCARQIPPQIAAQRIVAIADAINDQAPGMSIDGYILLFTQLEPKAALQMAITITPNAGEVVALPHAEQWTAELQALLKAQIGEEYAEETAAGGN